MRNIKLNDMISYPVEPDFQITSPFGNRIHPITKEEKFHKGIDIVCKKKEIYCIADGTLKAIGYNKEGYGFYVTIEHPLLECISRYAHLSDITVKNLKVGDPIKKNQIIGIMGQTGATTGEHLHFEIIQRFVHPVRGLEVEVIDPEKFFLIFKEEE
jgi:murein DD-endopeptidase MepM/ murein hydrolase activator NlpD